MEWLILSLVATVAGGWIMLTSLGRVGVATDRLIARAPVLASEAFRDGAYGKIAGVATPVAGAAAVTAPGSDRPCVWFELVVRRQPRGAGDLTGWKVVDRAGRAVELAIAVGDTCTVRVAPQDAVVIGADETSAPGHVGVGYRDRDLVTTVRSIAVGVPVHVLGTLSREVDPDPRAAGDYRDTAVRWRLVTTRQRPLVIAVVRGRNAAWQSNGSTRS